MHASALHLLDRVHPEHGDRPTEDMMIDLDTADVEVYGHRDQRVVFDHQDQWVGRHVATGADTSVVLAADPGDGRDERDR